MRDREIDEILKQAAQASPDVDPGLLDRIAGSIGRSPGPVRPLPPAWVLEGGLVLICAAVALAGAARLGLYGIRGLSDLERALIFSALGAFIWLTATACVSEMSPGSPRRVVPGLLLGAGSLALLAVFAVVFHDYGTDRFVAQGIACLTAGLLHAIPMALASWLLLRRGFAVNAVAAGLAAGTLAGLAGVTMLELHCANFEAPHVMLWHTAVLPLSAAAGALLGWYARSRRARAPRS
ncbi:MAG TPA: NrsF family protein [Bryobacteraceae bacterium]|nr:NrsF family protein [Bryobacteraceae bacterium]